MPMACGRIIRPSSEVSERLNEVEEVLKVEYKKYEATKKQAIKIVKKLLEKESGVTEDVFNFNYTIPMESIQIWL